MPDILELKPEGLYCAAGDFYVDPWRPVDRAIITHGHSDHARRGSRHYLCAPNSVPILKARLGDDISVEALEFEETKTFHQAKVSLHPAGHILGSAQVRIEVNGEVWVVSGDYKIEPDRTAEHFAPVRCHTFITETTFGLPIYQWAPQHTTFDQINAWWRSNQAQGKASLLMGYTLGKAQRLLAGVNREIGPILVHGSLTKINDIYRRAGVRLPLTMSVMDAKRGFEYCKALVVAPPSVQGSVWTRRLGDHSTAFASGWMAVRGMRRRSAVDRGFVLSDHVDWNGLLQAIRDTGAERILTTHGYAAQVSRYLAEQGFDSHPLETQFSGDEAEAQEEDDA